MITRIEIDGFKPFADFSLDVPPFLVLVGANNGGKSNLLEAVELARRVAASGHVNPLFAHERGNAQELFHRHPDGETDNRFTVRLAFSGPGAAAAGYAVTIHAERTPRLTVRTSVETDGDVARAELAAIRRLALSPAAMRSPATLGDERALVADGANLAAVLGRLKHSGDLSDLLVDATAVIKDLHDVETRVDSERLECDFVAEFGRGGRFRPNLLSDGTPRVLAILAVIHDRANPATLLVDEIETGLHPECLWQLLRRLRDRTADGSGRQVIVTTHSPVVVSHLIPDCGHSLRFLSRWTRGERDANGSLRSCSYTRALPVGSGGEPGTSATPQEVHNYSGTVSGAVE